MIDRIENMNAIPVVLDGLKEILDGWLGFVVMRDFSVCVTWDDSDVWAVVGCGCCGQPRRDYCYLGPRFGHHHRCGRFHLGGQ